MIGCGQSRTVPQGEGTDLGDITLLIRDFTSPNGLTMSPDEEILCLVHTRNGE